MSLLHFYKPEDFGAANFVMDFQMDIIDMNNPNILVKKGPNTDKLDKHDKNYIASTLMELWSETMNRTTLCFQPHRIKKCLCIGCCTYFILLVCMIAVLESNLSVFKSNEMKQIIAISLGFISIIVLAIILFGMLFVMQRRSVAREKWRNRFVDVLCSYFIELKQQYPNLTFSLIYPMSIYSQRIKSPAIHNKHSERIRLYKNSMFKNELLRGDEYISAIWCYLRVSEGSIVTSDSEPIYHSTQQHIRRDSKDSDYSRITSITSGFSLQIEDDKCINSKTKIDPPSKKGNVQTGKFPILSKNGRYKTLL